MAILRAVEGTAEAIRTGDFVALAQRVSELRDALQASAQRASALAEPLLTAIDALATRTDYALVAAEAYLCVARFVARDGALLARAKEGFAMVVGRISSEGRDAVYGDAGGLLGAGLRDGRELWYQTRGVTRCLEGIADTGERLVAFFRIARACDATRREPGDGLVKQQMLSAILRTAATIANPEERVEIYRDAALLAAPDGAFEGDVVNAFVACVEGFADARRRVGLYAAAARRAHPDGALGYYAAAGMVWHAEGLRSAKARVETYRAALPLLAGRGEDMVARAVAGLMKDAKGLHKSPEQRILAYADAARFAPAGSEMGKEAVGAFARSVDALPTMERVGFYRDAAARAQPFTLLETVALGGFQRNVEALPEAERTKALLAAAALAPDGELARRACARLEQLGIDPPVRDETWDFIAKLADEGQRPIGHPPSPHDALTMA